MFGVVFSEFLFRNLYECLEFSLEKFEDKRSNFKSHNLYDDLKLCSPPITRKEKTYLSLSYLSSRNLARTFDDGAFMTSFARFTKLTNV